MLTEQGKRVGYRTPPEAERQAVHILDEGSYTAFLTSPERRQRVQTRMRKAAPFTRARTRWRFGLKTRFVLLFA